MPFVLLFIGIILLTVAIRNQQTPFVHLVGGDFVGAGNFMYWVVALIVLGAIGYIPKAKPISNTLIVLILLVLILKTGNPATGVSQGIFQQLVNALQTTKTPSAPTLTGNTGVNQALSTGVAAGTSAVQTAASGG